MATMIELYKQGVKLKDEALREKDQGKFEQALALLTEAVALDDSVTLPLHAMVQCLTELGRHDEAVAVAQKIVQKEPDDMFAYISLSRAYQRGGKIPEAEYAMMQGQQAQMRAQAAKPR